MFPPFGENQQLAVDEVLDIAKFAIPLAWQHTMRMHGFVPVLHDENTFIEFCERCKFSECPTHNESGQERAANPEHNRRPVNRRQHEPNDAPTTKWCELHQRNSTHDMGACRTLLKQAQAMRRNYDTHKSTNKGVFKKHVMFKPRTFPKKNDREEQHRIEAIVESILSKKQSTKESADLAEFSNLHINNETEETKEIEVDESDSEME